MFDSLNVHIDLCRSMYKSYVDLNGGDFPMMIGKRHFTVICVLFIIIFQVKNVHTVFTRKSAAQCFPTF